SSALSACATWPHRSAIVSRASASSSDARSVASIACMESGSGTAPSPALTFRTTESITRSRFSSRSDPAVGTLPPSGIVQRIAGLSRASRRPLSPRGNHPGFMQAGRHLHDLGESSDIQGPANGQDLGTEVRIQRCEALGEFPALLTIERSHQLDDYR